MDYALRDKQFFLSDSRSALLAMFGLIALGTGVLVAMGAHSGSDAGTMRAVGAGIAALGLALLAGSWSSHSQRRGTWSELVKGDTVQGRVVNRTLIPGKYGGTMLTFEHEVGGKSYRTSLQGKQLDAALANLQPGDPVQMVVDPSRPQDARVRDFIAQPVG